MICLEATLKESTKQQLIRVVMFSLKGFQSQRRSPRARNDQGQTHELAGIIKDSTVTQLSRWETSWLN